MPLFALATLLPLILIALAALWGGVWAGFAIASMTLVIATLDLLTSRARPTAPDVEFPAGDLLSVTLALGHFELLTFVIQQLATAPHGFAAKSATFLAMGIFMGQVSHPNAHELIHRGSRALRRLGVWIYISLLFGQHASAHPLVHHVHVATDKDPSSARRGESFYRFAGRAWRGSFAAGLAAERARLARAGRSRWRNPYVLYLIGSLLCLTIAGLVGGVAGLGIYIGLAVFAQLQVLLSDYVQHYGLRRKLTPQGKPEPVGPAHSWNTPHPASSAMMLNAPRHSDHHAHPARPYPALQLREDHPLLPRSLPVMACLALWPRKWQQVMDPRVDALNQSD